MRPYRLRSSCASSGPIISRCVIWLGQMSQHWCMCRLAKAVHEEAAEGVPLQKLASLDELPTFDLQQWLHAKPVPNQVRACCASGTACRQP